MGMGYGGREVEGVVGVEVGDEWFVGWRLRFMSGMFGFKISGLKNFMALVLMPRRLSTTLCWLN